MKCELAMSDTSLLPVALFTRAWIEINRGCNTNAKAFVALFTRAWIEIKLELPEPIQDMRRPLHEGVD